MPEGYFDVIWGDSILHHLIENLDFVLARLVLWAKPGGLMVFSEPISLSRTLRKLRFMVPIKTDATPGERPLEPAELDLVNRFLVDLRVRCYSALRRLNGFFLVRCNYERSSLSRRAFANFLACLDYALLSLPLIQNMAGVCCFLRQNS